TLPDLIISPVESMQMSDPNDGRRAFLIQTNRHGNTGTVYCIQANGAIYDTDQQSAEMRRREREESQSKKKGGF
ncbi:hypothetical protein O5833_28980, partial [Escherichia coli]|nr:hypothetical protein [Escherichia coli]